MMMMMMILMMMMRKIIMMMIVVVVVVIVLIVTMVNGNYLLEARQAVPYLHATCTTPCAPSNWRFAISYPCTFPNYTI